MSGQTCSAPVRPLMRLLEPELPAPAAQAQRSALPSPRGRQPRQPCPPTQGRPGMLKQALVTVCAQCISALLSCDTCRHLHLHQPTYIHDQRQRPKFTMSGETGSTPLRTPMMLLLPAAGARGQRSALPSVPGRHLQQPCPPTQGGQSKIDEGHCHRLRAVHC